MGNPETSIIIRTYNEEKHIGNLLSAIQGQEYKDYEVIIVDSGSTDKTLEIVANYPAQVISIESRDFTFGYSLNIGCKEARGRYLVLASAHVLPLDTKWLSNLIAPFRDERIAKVYGRQVGHDVSKFSEIMDFKRIFGMDPVNSAFPLDYVNNANAALRKNLWDKRPFDEYLFGLEDIDWAKHATEHGHLIRYEPTAPVYHIHEEKWPQIFNRYRREAIAAARIGLPHPPQARTSWWRLLQNLILDLIDSFPNWSYDRLYGIVRFRYLQWKGTRQGWFRDKDVDLNRERQELFYSASHKAVVIHHKRNAKLKEVFLPEMKPGDILIKVAYVGVCRTDLEVYEGTLGYYRDGLASYPIVPGHEFSGTISKIGANNKFRERFQAGQRVVGECILSRGENSERKEVGVINQDGAYSHYVVVPGNHIHKLPEQVDLKTAALAEPLAVVLRALRRIDNRLREDSNILIIGAGPIGNLSAQALAARGHQKITVVDRRVSRLKALEEQVGEIATELPNASRFNVSIDATGSKAVLEHILEKSDVDATLLLLGFPYGKIHFDFEDIVGREKNIIGSVGADGEDFEEALQLMPKLNTELLTKVVLPLGQFKKAWEMQDKGEHLKILLEVNDQSSHE
jgi:2-desacetyl-2-hydroxyethyl bacteriochlorophyllide A dehydrogenase